METVMKTGGLVFPGFEVLDLFGPIEMLSIPKERFEIHIVAEQAGPVESGGDPRWIPLYQRILAAGKSVLILHVTMNELEPLLKAIGTRRVYTFMAFADQQQADQAMAVADKYRS